MENHSARHTAWVAGSIVLSALIISGVIIGINYYKQPPAITCANPTYQGHCLPPDNIIPTLSPTPTLSPPPSTTVPSPAATTTSTSIAVLPSSTPMPTTDVLVVSDQTKKFRWNEVSFQYPGNWTPGAEQQAYQGLKFTSTGKETVSITCPIPEIGFEGWDFGNPLMELKQNIPGTNNQYQKILSIAQPILEWGANGKPVLDTKNKDGNGWMALMMVRKYEEPTVPGIHGCMIKAVYNRAPTAAEKQSLQTMYNSVAIELANAKVASEAENIIRYVNPGYGFSIDFPKSWQKIKETDITSTANKNVEKLYQAVLRFTPEDAEANSGKQVTIMIYNQDQLATDPANIDVQGIAYLGKNNQYGYYWSGSSCDAVMAGVPDCKTIDEVVATNKEIGAIKQTFKINK